MSTTGNPALPPAKPEAMAALTKPVAALVLPVFFIAVWVMFMIAAVIVWSIAESSGTVGKIESFVSDLGITGWTLDGEFIVRQYGLIGLILSLAFTVGATIASVMFNLISDIVGGVWITVIEEETARPVSGSPTE